MSKFSLFKGLKQPSMLKILLILCSCTVALVLIELVFLPFFSLISPEKLRFSELRSSLDNYNFGAANLKQNVHGRANTSQLDWMENDVIHPYVGFVRNYENEDIYNNFGFLGAQTLYKKDPGSVIVGVFGGSVAWYIYDDAKEELVRQLQQIPEYQGKKIQLVSVALGGFKQPQQLLALNYILSLGGEFDVIINIDGFNDAALPYSDNYDANITPYYPRHWNIYSRKAVDLNTLPLIQKIATVQEKRKKWAGLFQISFLKELKIGLLVWTLRDGQLNRDLQKLNNQLETALKNQESTYQTTGPEPAQTKEESFSQSLKIWRESSLQIAKIAQANGIRYYHVLQPNQYLPDSKPMNLSERKVAFIDDVPDDTLLLHAYRYKEAIESVYPQMRTEGAQLKAEHNVSFLDMTQIFNGLSEPIYVDVCCHYNIKGTNLLISKIVEGIRKDLAENPKQEIR